jgi:hypothetical protein
LLHRTSNRPSTRAPAPPLSPPEAHAAALQPLIAAARADAAALADGLAAARADAAEAAAALEGARGAAAGLETGLEALQREAEAEARRLVAVQVRAAAWEEGWRVVAAASVSAPRSTGPPSPARRQALPERARRAADLAVAERAAAQQQLAAAAARLLEAEAAAQGAEEAEREQQVGGRGGQVSPVGGGWRPAARGFGWDWRELCCGAQRRLAPVVFAPAACTQALHVQALSALERARILAEAKERHAAGITRDVEMAGVEAEKTLAEGAALDVRLAVGGRAKRSGVVGPGRPAAGPLALAAGLL